jgi:transcriptional regulator with XRE-family HTH domain
VIKNTKEFLEKNGLTQAQVARSIGMSSGAISQYLKGEYKGNIENLEKKLSDFIKNYNFKDEKSSKGVEIVEEQINKNIEALKNISLTFKELKQRLSSYHKDDVLAKYFLFENVTFQIYLYFPFS